MTLEVKSILKKAITAFGTHYWPLFLFYLPLQILTSAIWRFSNKDWFTKNFEHLGWIVAGFVVWALLTLWWTKVFSHFVIRTATKKNGWHPEILRLDARAWRYFAILILIMAVILVPTFLAIISVAILAGLPFSDLMKVYPWIFSLSLPFTFLASFKLDPAMRLSLLGVNRPIQRAWAATKGRFVPYLLLMLISFVPSLIVTKFTELLEKIPALSEGIGFATIVTASELIHANLEIFSALIMVHWVLSLPFRHIRFLKRRRS